MSDALMDDGKVEHPRGVRRRNVEPHPAEQMDAFAALADSKDSDALFDLMSRGANAILDCQGWVTMGLVRVHLGAIGKLANDGKESLASIGSVGRRMGLVAIGTVRQPKELAVGHQHWETIWVRPTSSQVTLPQRAELVAVAQSAIVRSHVRKKLGLAA